MGNLDFKKLSINDTNEKKGLTNPLLHHRYHSSKTTGQIFAHLYSITISYFYLVQFALSFGLFF